MVSKIWYNKVNPTLQEPVFFRLAKLDNLSVGLWGQ